MSAVSLSLRLSVLPLVVGVTACNFYKEKPFKDAFLTRDEPASVSYQLVREKVFIPKCISCHGSSGGVNLETYANTKANLVGIERTAVSGRTMPKGGVLSSAEIDLLASWIKAGAPENSEPTSPSSPSPDPSPFPSFVPEEPLTPTWGSIKKRVIDQRCISCHSSGGSASWVPLGSWKEVVESPLELVLPGNADESGLMIAITRADDKRMPPGGPALPEEEIEAIRQWIEAGAKSDTGEEPPAGL